MSQLNIGELDAYDYAYPKNLIAQKPIRPRDVAKLLVYDRESGRTSFNTFKNLTKYLPPRSVLVFNKTKVIPARLTVKKSTGGRVHLLYLETRGNLIKVLADKNLSVGAQLSINRKLGLVVVRHDTQFFWLRPSFPIKNLLNILERYGSTPIPPYIKHTLLSERELRKEYQTIFARAHGSVAAPTASLHFTASLIKKIKQAGHDVCFITLHVNLGTFAPVTEIQLKTGRLHSEQYEIDAATIRRITNAKQQGRKIIAVGTTVVRALESLWANSYELAHKKTCGETDLFIRPGYRFKIVDSLVTNFHVPRSSLMMLVAALIRRDKLLALYRQAIKRRFRLFSFGDGMLIL